MVESTITVRCLLQAENEQQLQRMEYWMASKFREASRNSNQGVIITGIYDANGQFKSAVQMGGDDVGDLQVVLDEAFDLDPELDQEPRAS